MLQRTMRRAVLAAAVGAMFAGVWCDSAAAQAQNQQDEVAVLRDYLSGNGLLDRGLYDLAAEEYRSFLREHPNHEKAPTARYGLSVALFRLGQYEAATSELKKLVDVDDFEFAAETDFLLGQALLQLGQFDAATTAFDRLINEHPAHDSTDDATALLAEALYRGQQYDKVEGAVATYEARWPDGALRERVELFAGLADLARSDHESAVERFRGLLQRYPDGAFAERATLLLGRAHQRLDQLDDAAKQYQLVLNQGNDVYVPEALYGLGVIHRQRDAPGDAVENLLLLLERYSAHTLVTPARFELGQSYFALDQFELAREQFDTVAQAESDLADDASYWAGKSLLRRGELDETIDRLGEAIATYPDSELQPEMQYDLAVAQLRADETDEAVRTLRGFLSRFDDHDLTPEAVWLAASATHQLQQYDASDRLCEQFIEQFGDHPRTAAVAYLHGENAYLAGDLEMAVARFTDFRNTFPRDDRVNNATYRLGMALYRLDRSAEAQEELQAVVDGEDTKVTYQPGLFALGNIAFDNEEWASCAESMSAYLAGESAVHADDALIRLGLAQHRLEQYDDAIDTYEQLLDKFDESPHRAQAMFETGQAHLALEQFEDAEASFITVLDMQGSGRFEVHALNHLGALTMRADRHEDAAQWYGRLADSEADDATAGEALFQRGQALFALDRFEEAQQAFERLIDAYEEHDRSPLARANVVLCLARQGEHEKTITAIESLDDDMRESLPLAMQNTLAYEHAWAYRALGDEQRASEVYHSMLEAAPEEDLTVYARVELAELECAAEHYEKSRTLLADLEMDDEQLDASLRERAHYRLGVCEYGLSEFDAAAEAFEQFAKEYPDSEHIESALLLGGESLFQTEQFKQAAELLQRLLDRDELTEESQASALLRLGECQAQLQQFAASEETFRQHRKQFADSPVWFQAQFGIGWALENQDQLDDAIDAYRVVTERHEGPTAARAQFQIGECLFAKKEHEAAVRELLKVDILYAYPQWSAAALYEAGRCFEAMAQTGQARQQYQQVVNRFSDSRWAPMAKARLEAINAAS